MSHPVPFSDNVLNAARRITGITEEQRNYFAAAFDYLERDLIRQLADGAGEIVRVAEKNSDNTQHPAKASVSAAIIFDITNIEMLNISISTAVAPWKFKASGETTEDLRQFHFDFENGTVERDEQNEEENRDSGEVHVAGGAKLELYTAGELEEKEGKELRALAEAKGYKPKARDTKKILISTILAAQANPPAPEGAEAQGAGGESSDE